MVDSLGGILMIEGIDAIIFDLGGTLYKTEKDLGDVHRRFLTELGLEALAAISDKELEGAQSRGPDAWLDEFMLKKRADLHWEPSREDWVEYDKRLLTSLGAEGDIEILANEYQTKWDTWLRVDRYIPLDGCKETLVELKNRGYKLGVASNRFGDPRPFLKKDGILSLFDSVEYTAVPGYKKPSPYMLLKVADELGVNPRKCVYVGNYVRYDVEAASRGELTPILIIECNLEERAVAPADTIMIEHLPELLELLPES
jgi:HAD superfamily hydrolase (TIGR01549 family)